LKEAPIDLHVHTTFSDGTSSPSKVVHLAKSAGLRAIAITDHDTLRGNKEAIDEGRKVGVEVVPGVEVSVDMRGGTMHVLGYYVDYNYASLIEVLQRVEEGRHERNEEILGKLGDLGMALDYDEIKAVASEGPVGRPHIAQTLVQRGHVASTREAFDKYLKKGAPAYAERLRFSEAEAIRSIREAGGIAVLSHPNSLNCANDADLSGIVERLAAVGLQGIEAHYPSHSPKVRRALEALAEQYGLLATGGTDFHGDMYPEVSIGFGYGDLYVPYSIVQAMKERLAANKAGCERKEAIS
jgi:predicted metal-dependent phosphoesterase TrpH